MTSSAVQLVPNQYSRKAKFCTFQDSPGAALPGSHPKTLGAFGRVGVECLKILPSAIDRVEWNLTYLVEVGGIWWDLTRCGKGANSKLVIDQSTAKENFVWIRKV